MTLMLGVDRTGRVGWTGVKESPANAGALVRCARRAARAWRFPGTASADTGRVLLIYPFVFVRARRR